jgi:hypothetical protein
VIAVDDKVLRGNYGRSQGRHHGQRQADAESMCEKAGLKNGDLILKVGDTAIAADCTPDKFWEIIEKIDGSIKLTVTRFGGKQYELQNPHQVAVRNPYARVIVPGRAFSRQAALCYTAPGGNPCVCSCSRCCWPRRSALSPKWVMLRPSGNSRVKSSTCPSATRSKNAPGDVVLIYEWETARYQQQQGSAANPETLERARRQRFARLRDPPA